MLATVWLFGCCALPFHYVVHRLMPVCQTALAVLHGGHNNASKDPAPPPVKRNTTERMTAQLRTRFAPRSPRIAGAVVAMTPAAYRSFISHGAVRCDHDIGTRLASLDTLLI